MSKDKATITLEFNDYMELREFINSPYELANINSHLSAIYNDLRSKIKHQSDQYSEETLDEFEKIKVSIGQICDQI